MYVHINSITVLLLQQFSKEILADDIKDIDEKKIRDILEKSSGAAYGTGK